MDQDILILCCGPFFGYIGFVLWANSPKVGERVIGALIAGPALSISMFAFYAARVILVALIILSVFTVAFFIERLIFFMRHFLKDGHAILMSIEGTGSLDEIRKVLQDCDKAEAAVVLQGLGRETASGNEFTRKVTAHLHLEKEQWERYLLFLGSVGSNAPFIGLLGTVFGILKSFADLGASVAGGPQVVMAGISEALIVTAAGLAVAIPAVIFFNICKTRVKKAVTRVEALVEMINSKDIF